MLTTLAGLPASAADSARAAASVYTASLLATAPIVAAAIGAVAMRRAAAEGRVLVWRVGRRDAARGARGSFAPAAARRMVGPFDRRRAARRARAHPGRRSRAACRRHAQLRTRRIALDSDRVRHVRRRRGRGAVAHGPRVDSRPANGGTSSRARRRSLVDDRSRGFAVAPRRTPRVLLFQSREVNVPMTWGLRHAVILLPTAADAWTAGERRMVLRHELAHVRGADWAFGLAVAFRVRALLVPSRRVVDRALAASRCRAGRRRSRDLVGSRSQRLRRTAHRGVDRAGAPRIETALALSGRGPLRARLAAILDAGREVRPLARRWTLVATAACAVSAVPLCGVEIVPTRDVLASLMRDSRWESRAYAVIGLAHRADTVAFARSAAELDPEPARAGVGALRARPASRSGAGFRRRAEAR